MQTNAKPIEQQTVLITGATDGLGLKLAEMYAQRGATLLLHGRNEEKGKFILEKLKQNTGNKTLKYFNADFSSLQSVRDLGAAVQKEYQNIDTLINNAGLGSGKTDIRNSSTEGYELLFTVNYLAPFLLTHLLLPQLHQAVTSKVINVVSRSQREINFDDLMLEQNYSGRQAYAQSKLALIMFTFTLAGQSKDSKLRVNAVHPESLMNTKMVIEKYGSAETSVEAGADSIWHVATSPEVENLTGAYFEKKELSKAAGQAYDLSARDQLYRISKQLVKI